MRLAIRMLGHLRRSAHRARSWSVGRIASQRSHTVVCLADLIEPGGTSSRSRVRLFQRPQAGASSTNGVPRKPVRTRHPTRARGPRARRRPPPARPRVRHRRSATAQPVCEVSVVGPTPHVVTRTRGQRAGIRSRPFAAGQCVGGEVGAEDEIGVGEVLRVGLGLPRSGDRSIRVEPVAELHARRNEETTCRCIDASWSRRIGRRHTTHAAHGTIVAASAQPARPKRASPSMTTSGTTDGTPRRPSWSGRSQP
jgi:hypothetical protein